ncbi:MAG: hypothetical protein LC650_05235, partial [Actinobacteria bacterium]|nr:hypothetical protein [Actinomycetota bacterium]
MNPEQQLISDLTQHSKYARFWKELERREVFEETVARNRNMHRTHVGQLSTVTDHEKVLELIDWAFAFVRNREVMPSMRSMQFGGDAILENHVKIYNCSHFFADSPDFFAELMYLLLCGTGVGYSVRKQHVSQLPFVKPVQRYGVHVVEDSIEGWADAVKVVSNAYLLGEPLPAIFDYSLVRPKGTLIRTSGGKAPGPEPLKQTVDDLISLFDSIEPGAFMRPIQVHDAATYIARAVLSGGIRRSAMIALFSPDDEEMLTCKTGDWWKHSPDRAYANNSAVLLRGRDDELFHGVFARARESGSGEPGISWVDDEKWGVNPCHEISLLDHGLCNLSTLNVGTVRDQQDFNDRARAGGILGTLQASYTDFPYLRPEWKETCEMEALLGVSMTGIASGAIDHLDAAEAVAHAVAANVEVAALLGINPAARVTAIKPEGCRPGHALVTTDQGIKMLSEVMHEDNTAWGEYEAGDTIPQTGDRVTRTYKNGVADVYRISMQNGLVVESTRNHPWFVKGLHKNSKLTPIEDFIETGSIAPGMVLDINLASYRNETPSGLSRVTTQGMASNVVDIKMPTEMNEDIAWFFGYLWGNGSMSPNKKRVRFIDGHMFNLERVQKVLREQFGRDVNILEAPNKRAWTLDIGSIVFWEWIVANGLFKYTEQGT